MTARVERSAPVLTNRSSAGTGDRPQTDLLGLPGTATEPALVSSAVVDESVTTEDPMWGGPVTYESGSDRLGSAATAGDVPALTDPYDTSAFDALLGSSAGTDPFTTAAPEGLFAPVTGFDQSAVTAQPTWNGLTGTDEPSLFDVPDLAAVAPSDGLAAGGLFTRTAPQASISGPTFGPSTVAARAPITATSPSDSSGSAGST